MVGMGNGQFLFLSPCPSLYHGTAIITPLLVPMVTLIIMGIATYPQCPQFQLTSVANI
jgi:hypothetical protein